MKRVVLASANAGKLRELNALLAPVGMDVVPQSQFAIEAAEETGETFIENAIIKARHAARLCALPAIADDSGLIVDALDGAPGVRSARYAGVGASDEENLRLLLDNMRGIPDARRGASFVCVMVYMRDPHDACPRVGEGLWRGRITHAPRGDGGFGYDPVFFVEERGCTSAELAPADKNSISHRATAMRALLAHLEAS
ncbi:MAG: RdgB/HAM1 family non-canonical purine NTP pyrophosphatase [Gammaproteobacteria bacterium]|nr:RdgB/HAM1 family non-canonical purine NTP pyrophosphatase [Gammaproteobacteria bacterium]NIM73209.1 RdgB/HAM1 family non-canonical purine NTP pyrophosphatase [Gammaproteobacteria bacterium]NIN40045.1 RdgB/HAM1 family non-canonical purine NTP pyrophosphatase [Gammaproteobacteria bacterium]NIO26259.1 RdgB/HAM1 family non-canonical purine NTP pyrophosphatase [Gammaproteobacteria bacterium]NIO66068.1 RdgB/HAM1 family non-canonical purine NTP pyrophosphatase [Gammaproteobacteria bacterium]